MYCVGFMLRYRYMSLMMSTPPVRQSRVDLWVEVEVGFVLVIRRDGWKHRRRGNPAPRQSPMP